MSDIQSKPAETFPLVLERVRELSPVVRELTFARKDGRALDFEAGQWLNLVIPQAEGEIKRAYSIASDPGSGTIQFAVTRVDGGPGSTFLHSLQPGAELTAIGPHGLFVRRHAGPALFVGTGTGVTPLRSMLKHALRHHATEPLWLLFGVRTEADQIYQDEFNELMSAHPNFKVFYTLSRPSSNWTSRTGYVQHHTRELHELLSKGQGDTAPEVHVYICGLKRMIDEVRELLRKEMGLARQWVHSERYD